MSVVVPLLCQVPALSPPDGVEPNFVNPATLETSALVFAVILTTVSSLFVLNRLLMNIRFLGLGDVFVFISWLISIAYAVTFCGIRKFYRHQWDIPACWFDGNHMKWVFAEGLFLPLAPCFAKAAILMLFFQLFRINRAMRIAIIVGLVADFLIYGVSIILVPYFQAPHIGETWADLLAIDRPWKMALMGPIQGSLATLLDLYILVLPFPVLSMVHLKGRRRLKLFIVFGTAILGVIASVLALVYRIRLLTSTADQWAQAQSSFCIMAENNTALIIACMPALANFISNYAENSTIYKYLISRLSTTQESRGDAFVSKSRWTRSGQGGTSSKKRSEPHLRWPAATCDELDDETSYNLSQYRHSIQKPDTTATTTKSDGRTEDGQVFEIYRSNECDSPRDMV